MKNIRFVTAIILTGFIAFASCKKDAGFAGKKEVSGTISYASGTPAGAVPAPFALVHICYGTLEAKSPYDLTIVADSVGNYKIKGLTSGKNGDYFFTAEFIDANGFKYTTSGVAVSLRKHRGTVTVDLNLE